MFFILPIGLYALNKPLSSATMLLLPWNSTLFKRNQWKIINEWWSYANLFWGSGFIRHGVRVVCCMNYT